MDPPMRMVVPGIATSDRGSQGNRTRASRLRASAQGPPPKGTSAQLRCLGKDGSLRVNAFWANASASSRFRDQTMGGGTGRDSSHRVFTLSAACRMAWTISSAEAAAKPPAPEPSSRVTVSWRISCSQVAEGERIEGQRFIRFFGCPPSKTVGPEITQGIAEQLDQRTCGLQAVEGPDQ